MSTEDLVASMGLPPECRVDRRVPKKLLLEQGGVTASDKRNIQDGLEELHWIAALKPENVGVSAYKDDVREYVEVAVLVGRVRGGAKLGAIAKVIHRAIPYPVVLWLVRDGAASLSVAHKRWSQAEAGQVVTEDIRQADAVRPEAPTDVQAAFLKSLAVADLPQGNLYVLYHGWHDRVAALEAARITGSFGLAPNSERATGRLGALAIHAQQQRELAALRAKAARETQISRRVELNLAIQRIEADLAAAKKAL